MSKHNQALFELSGISDIGDAGIVLVHTEWNKEIVDELVKGCENILVSRKITKIKKVTVPGAIELSFACRRYFEATQGTPDRPDAIIAFGCVIRGETPHFDYVCQSVTQGITQLNLSLPVPVIFGILTVDNMAQAKDRIGGEHGHKGKECAITALKMIAFNKSLF